MGDFTNKEFSVFFKSSGLYASGEALQADEDVFIAFEKVEERLNAGHDNIAVLQEYRVLLEKVKSLLINTLIDAVDLVIEHNATSNVIDLILGRIAEARLARNRREIIAVMQKATHDLESLDLTRGPDEDQLPRVNFPLADPR